MLSARRAHQRRSGAGEWAYTQSMFHALRVWELGELRRLLCLRRRMSAGPITCAYLCHCGPAVENVQPRLQSLAMRRVRVATWQMVTCPSDGKDRRYWEESVTWRCDEMWRDETSNCPRRTTGRARSGNVLFLADRTAVNVLSRASWGCQAEGL